MELFGNKGFTVVAALVIILVGLLAVPAYHVVKDVEGIFNPDAKAKTEVTQLVATQKQEQVVQTKVDTDNDKIIAAKTATISTMQVKEDNVHQLVTGVGYSLAKEKNPSVNVQVASVLNSDADHALDPISAAKAKEMQDLVDRLTSQNAIDKAAAQQQLDQITDKLTQANTQIVNLNTQVVSLNNDKAQDVVQLNGFKAKVTGYETSLTKWASDNASLLAKIKNLTMWLIILGAVFFIIHWALPLVAAANPAVAPVAKFLSSIIAWPLSELHKAEKAIVSAGWADAKAALAKIEAALEAEKTAHAATQKTLVQVATQTK